MVDVGGDTHSPRVHLNLNVRGLRPSATLAINELSAELQREGRQVFRLGLGQSPFPVAPPVVEALKRNAHQKDYLPVRGLMALRESVAAYYQRRHGVQRSPDDVLVGPGSKELMFLIQLAYYGDLVIPTPSWVSYAPQAQIIGRHVRWLPTLARHSWRLQPSELESLCAADADRPRLLILNYPNNPVGGTFSEEELRRLADVARRYRVVMLSDEIYGEIHHRGEHVSVAHFYPEGTIVSSGLSKWCGAGGWRLGTFTFPPGLRWLLEGMAVVASETFTSTSAPIQHAAVRAFEGGEEIESYLGHSRRVLACLGRLCAERLRGAGAAVEPPEGAFYLFPDFRKLRSGLKARGITTSGELCRRLLEETGVATLPGADFGRPPSELTLRLAYVDFDGAAALAAAERRPGELGDDFAREHCGRVVQAIERIADWAAR
jgi:aspartate aminotransferase